jgi:hypothetical protein
VRLRFDTPPPEDPSSVKSATEQDPLAAFNSEGSETGQRDSSTDFQPEAGETGQVYSLGTFSPELAEASQWREAEQQFQTWQPDERWRYFPASAESPKSPAGIAFLTLLGMTGLAVVGAGSIAMLNALSERVASGNPDSAPAALHTQAPPPSQPSVQIADLSRAQQPRDAAAAAVPMTPAPRVDVPPPSRDVAPTRQSEESARASRPPTVVPVSVPPAPQQVIASAPSSALANVSRSPLNVPVSGGVPPRVENVPPPPAAPASAATTGLSTVEAPSTARVGAAPAALPSARVAAPPAAPAASAAAPVTSAVITTSAIEAVLGRYASAFNALDASRAKAVWPSVNERNLDRAFDSLEQQQFDLGACDIQVTAPKAIASCDGTARYTPKVGNRKERVERRQWTFRLQQASTLNWTIESVDSR